MPFQAHLYPEESFHIALFTETHNWKANKKTLKLKPPRKVFLTHLETVRQALDVPVQPNYCLKEQALLSF